MSSFQFVHHDLGNLRGGEIEEVIGTDSRPLESDPAVRAPASSPKASVRRLVSYPLGTIDPDFLRRILVQSLELNRCVRPK